MLQQLTNTICRGYRPSLLELLPALVLEQSTDVRLSNKYRFFLPFPLKMLVVAL
jgi:hypothetical protein